MALSHLDISLLEAVRSRSFVDVQQLLQEGADVNAQDPATGRTPLHEAVMLETTDFARRRILNALFAHNPDVNRQDARGLSPLHTATLAALKSGKTEPMQMLIERGANSHLRDAEGLTALDHARGRIADYYMTVISFLEDWEKDKPPARRAQEQEAAVFDLQHNAAEEAQARLRKQARGFGPRLKL